MTTAVNAARGFAAERVRNIPVSGLVELLDAARSMGAVDMASGVPGWPMPPPPMIEAAREELRTGSHQYEHPNGNVELRTQIAASLSTPANPDTEITITVGGSEALCVSMLSAVNPGDEVIVLEPFYENFLSAIATAGGQPRFVRLRAPEWRWDSAELAASFNTRTRAIVLNSPSNPTGHVLSEGELSELAVMCQRWNVTVVSDEVYSPYIFDERTHVSVADVPGLRERAITIGSLSKSHAVSGWRLGHLRAPAEITAVLRRVHVATSCGTAGPLQRAAARSGVLGSAWGSGRELQDLRDRTVSVFSSFGLGCLTPEGGCYVFADIRPCTADDCNSFVRRMLTERGVLIVPGRFFFEDQNSDSGFVRIAFNKPRTTLELAARRLLQDN
ncbi:MAG: pyridoxal phosphate-dependent aminotransferase [Pseudonocardiaceae bacterium]